MDNGQLEASVHWLRLSFSWANWTGIRDLCDRMWGASEAGRACHSYQASMRYAGGAALWFDKDGQYRDAIHGGKFTLEVPGGALEVLPHEKLVELLLTSSSLGGCCIRLDAALDDVARRVVPGDVVDLFRRGCMSGFRKMGTRQDERIGGVTLRDECSFGTRGSAGSGKYLRVYDKWLESLGENKAVRWEMEFSGERAGDGFLVLVEAARRTKTSLGSYASLSRAVASLVTGNVDFVDRGHAVDARVSRCQRVPFWSAICAAAGRCTLAAKVAKSTMTGKMDWVKFGVGKSLGMIRTYMMHGTQFPLHAEQGFLGFLREVVAYGESRMKQQDYDLATSGKVCPV